MNVSDPGIELGVLGLGVGLDEKTLRLRFELGRFMQSTTVRVKYGLEHSMLARGTASNEGTSGHTLMIGGEWGWMAPCGQHRRQHW